MSFKMFRDLSLTCLVLVGLLLNGCSSGDTEELRTTIYVNQLDVQTLEIRLDADKRILDINDAQQQALELVGIRSDSSEVPVNKFVQWSSSAPDVVSVNGSGVVTGVSNGVATITASVADISTTIEITASDALLVSIAPAISDPDVPVCSFENTLTAEGSYDDLTVRNISDSVVWESDDTTIVEVIKSNGINTVLAKAGGMVSLTAHKGVIVSPDLDLDITAGALTSISVTSATDRVEVESVVDFVAMGTYGDASVRNITLASDWSSADPTLAIAVDGAPGRYEGIKIGNVGVTAECDGQSGNASLEVIKKRVKSGIEIRDQFGNEADEIQKDPTALDFQLRVYYVYSDDSVEEITAADDEFEEIEWTIQSNNASGVLSLTTTGDDAGTIDLLGGQANVQIKVRLSNDEDTIAIDVDEKY